MRIKSCWGGLVAFDATYFQAPAAAHERLIRSEGNATQPTDSVSQVPIRFRAEADLYWEASECCLVHADLLSASKAEQEPGLDAVGIYMNPYIRVAYGTWTLPWLWFTRRMEKLYIMPHSLVNHVAGLPRFNPRRTEIAGKEVQDRVWVAEEGSAAGGSFQEGRPSGRDWWLLWVPDLATTQAPREKKRKEVGNDASTGGRVDEGNLCLIILS